METPLEKQPPKRGRPPTKRNYEEYLVLYAAWKNGDQKDMEPLEPPRPLEKKNKVRKEQGLSGQGEWLSGQGKGLSATKRKRRQHKMSVSDEEEDAKNKNKKVVSL